MPSSATPPSCRSSTTQCRSRCLSTDACLSGTNVLEGTVDEAHDVAFEPRDQIPLVCSGADEASWLCRRDRIRTRTCLVAAPTKLGDAGMSDGRAPMKAHHARM